MRSIERDDILEILKIVGQSDIDELRLEIGDFKLILNKAGARPAGRGVERDVPQPEETAASSETSSAVDQRPAGVEKPRGVLPEAPRELETPELMEENGYTPIKAPILGTFYRAPKPGAPPFVTEDQLVTEDDTLCIIEVMKLFNTVKAGVGGYIREICAKDGELVEFNQTLFMVEEVEGEESLAEGQN